MTWFLKMYQLAFIHILILWIQIVLVSGKEPLKNLRRLPPAQFDMSPTLFTNTTGGMFDIYAIDMASKVAFCRNDAPSEHNPTDAVDPKSHSAQTVGSSHCDKIRRRCFLERFGWCHFFYSQKRVPWKTILRGNTSCPVDEKGVECAGMGVCNYDFGVCECPAGWKGKACEKRVRQRCHNNPGSLRAMSLKLDNFTADMLETLEFDPEDPDHWLKYVINEGEWFASRCAGYCEDVSGLCYCGLGPNRYKKPPPGSAPDALGSGRLLGHTCKPGTNQTGQKLEWGSRSWEWIYGPRGYCMLPDDSEEMSDTKEYIPRACSCDLGTSHGKFCNERHEAFCVNNCNGHGECRTGFCRCLPGWYGNDCSLKRAGSSMKDAAVEEHLVRHPWQRDGFTMPKALEPLYDEILTPLSPEAIVKVSGQREVKGRGSASEEDLKACKGEERGEGEGEEIEKCEEKERKEKGEEEKGKEEEKVDEGQGESEELKGQGKSADLRVQSKNEELKGQEKHGKDQKQRDKKEIIVPGSKGRLRPLIYVYDLARFSSQILQYSYAARTCTYRRFSSDSNLTEIGTSVYDVETYFHETLLSSEHRTFDPEEADFFYVPTYQTCFLHPTLNWGEQPTFAPHFSSNRALHATYFFDAAVNHLKINYPFWNRTSGRDHIFVTFHDEGACYLPQEIYNNSVLLTSWGRMDLDHKSNTAYSLDNYSDFSTQGDPKRWQAMIGKHPCYDPERHLVLASFKAPSHFAYSPLMGYPPLKRDIFFFFKGDMGSFRDPRYSRQVRQKLLKLSQANSWDSKFGIYVLESNKIVDYQRVVPYDNEYSHMLARSKFCAVMPGDGYSSRFEDAVLHGCIPVIIQDHVHVSFESILDIDSFSIRIPQSAVNEHLPYILLGISDEQVERMQRKLGSIYYRYAYAVGSVMHQSIIDKHHRTDFWLHSQNLVAGKDHSSRGHPYEPVKNFPVKSDAFHTVMQWLSWQRHYLEGKGELPAKTLL